MHSDFFPLRIIWFEFTSWIVCTFYALYEPQYYVIISFDGEIQFLISDLVTAVGISTRLCVCVFFSSNAFASILYTGIIHVTFVTFTVLTFQSITLTIKTLFENYYIKTFTKNLHVTILESSPMRYNRYELKLSCDISTKCFNSHNTIHFRCY